MTKRVTVAITGASGAQYALRLVECLLAAGCEVSLLISKAGEIVIREETGLALPGEEWGIVAQQQFLQNHFWIGDGQLKLYGREDWFSHVASGSAAPTEMVICPASGGTVSAIAHGASNNLIERAADVILKENRKLIIVPRETPLSAIHLENLLKLSKLGVVILPAAPGFYHQPQSINDLIDFIVGRILDQLDVPQSIMPRWGN